MVFAASALGLEVFYPFSASVKVNITFKKRFFSKISIKVPGSRSLLLPCWKKFLCPDED